MNQFESLEERAARRIGVRWAAGFVACLGLLTAGCQSNPAAVTDAGTDATTPECATAADCPSGSSVCGVATCDNGTCGLAPATQGKECRASAGACDVAETCDGTSMACPADAVLTAGKECRASAGDCDVAEACDGVSAACPADGFAAVGTQCRAAEGMCDAAEVCDGATASCPPPDAIDSQCQPMTPITFNLFGRDVTVTTVDLAGTGSPVATVAPGATVSLHIVGSWVSDGVSCPGCVTQIYARLNGVFSLCFGSDVTNESFDQSTTFTAPTTPGVYLINSAGSWQYSCQADTTVSTTFSSSTLATLIVQ